MNTYSEQAMNRVKSQLNAAIKKIEELERTLTDARKIIAALEVELADRKRDDADDWLDSV